LETCGVPESWFRNEWDVKYILSEALRWHVSTLNVKSSAIPVPWKSDFDDFERKMGYRLALRRAEWQQKMHAGQAIGLTTWWVNEGVAPIYRPFVLAFRFTSSSQCCDRANRRRCAQMAARRCSIRGPVIRA
jgi:hypothetical protein